MLLARERTLTKITAATGQIGIFQWQTGFILAIYLINTLKV